MKEAREEKKRKENRTYQNKTEETFEEDKKEEPEKRETRKEKKGLFQAIPRSLSEKKISFLNSPWSPSTNSSAPSCVKSAKFTAKSPCPPPSCPFLLAIRKRSK